VPGPSGHSQSGAVRHARRRSHPYVRRATVLLRGPGAVALAVLTALALGYWGYASLPGRDYSFSDDLYRALQLFNGGAELPRSGTPWQLEIARWLAPATVAYAAFAAFFALARQQVQRVRTRLFARDHVLIVGLGSRGSKLARALREHYRVVVVEADSTNGAATALRHDGIPVLVGDARDPATLRAARADRAAHVVVVAGGDSLNLQIAAALARLDAETPGAAAHHVTIDSPILWEELNRIPLDRSAARGVEFVSIPDRIAVALIGAAVEHWVSDGGDGLQVLIRGEGPAAARLVAHLVRSEALGEGPEIDIACDELEEIVTLVRRADPWVLEQARIAHAGDDVGRAAGRVDVAFVCGLPEAAALSDAIEIARGLTGDAHVYTAVEDPGVASALTGAGVDVSRLVTVAASDSVLGDGLLRGRAGELLARTRHSELLLDRIAAGYSSELPWDRLPESERASHRRLATEIAAELGVLGAELVPLHGPEANSDLPLDDDALDRFGRDVHDRWIRAEREVSSDVMSGPHAVGWSKLPEVERERIRAEIRALPSLVGRAGYTLNWPEGSAKGS
jgi:voltage-gated potassium channel Kch